LTNKTTVIIKTIGRKSVKAAIESAKREGFTTHVISDGIWFPPDQSEPDLQRAYGGTLAGADSYTKLGRRWGYYGGMAANVGAALAETEFVTFLDDDDEFAPGAGEAIRRNLEEKPDVDVWIGGVRFNTAINVNNTATGEVLLESTDLSMNGELGIVPGNVCMPTYRTSIFSVCPFRDNIPKEDVNLTDFYHIKTCELSGYKVDWFGQVIYLVRPVVGGVNGAGE
tara:strand:- start:2717 stop:3391 length:675 start_codon:yes stop_codon:yes gene_type:complete